MRLLITTTAIAALLSLPTSLVVEAKTSAKSKSASAISARRQQSALDPAGNYAVYPLWAQNALAPKAGGAGR